MQNSQCNKCGRPVDAGVRFCPDCGSPVMGKAPSRIGRSGNWKRDGLIMGILAVVVAAAYLGFREEPEAPRTKAPPATPGHESMAAEMMENLPTDYGSLVEMGNRFMDQQNFPMAAELYRRALEIDSSSPDVRSDFASCLHAMGLPDRALEEFRRIAAEHPDHATVRFNLGIVFHTLGDIDSARYYWQKCLEMEPDGGPAESARRYLDQLGT